ncbi:MAG: KpsF/GutQ family sugar-phosphate isomerase [Candidatus Coatesbacteria bacterium]|nr:MAG: KpsF/GutQ family sugar-phosphate isomerase [Candidatus Coatesbacteria bacterium]
MDSDGIIERAKRVVAIEAEAVAALIGRPGDGFVGAVEAVYATGGRVITTGIGKSGIIAQKLAATLSSTGTPAYFLHPVEAAHGDLGVVGETDVAVVISYSGETSEITSVVPALLSRGATVVAITGVPGSSLAESADHVIDASVDREACPLGLVPTASTTAALVMADALAICVMELKGFAEDDFALFHPGGDIGRRLLSGVKTLIHTGGEVPQVESDAPLDAIVAEMSAKTFGITAVVDGGGKLTGVITDGDLRRLLERGEDLSVVRARDFCTGEPKTIKTGDTTAHALQLMEKHQITALFAVDDDGHPTGVIHIHDILGRGRVSITG